VYKRDGARDLGQSPFINREEETKMQKLLKKACALAVAAILLSMPLTAFAAEPAIPSAVRDFFEDRGATVEWYDPLQQVTITLGQNVAMFRVGDTTINIGDTAVELHRPVILSDDIAYMYLMDLAAILSTLFPPPAIDSHATYTHGQIAYRYLYFIEENLYSRIGFTQRERDTAEWIAAELIAMGHPAENVRLQEFPIVPHMAHIAQAAAELDENATELPRELMQLMHLNMYTPACFLQHTFIDHSQNVILTVPGVSERRIIVGAHYDSPNSPGISDNASGIVTLLESAYRILNLDHYYTITYIFLGAEELGLIGAYYYVNALSEEEIDNIALMINVDVIFDGFVLQYGVGYHCFEYHTELGNHVTDTIAAVGNALNAEFGFEFVHSQYGIYVSSDQLAFLSLGIPVLVFFAVDDFPLSPRPIFPPGHVWENPFTPERIELLVLMLDECDDEETLAAIEADMDMLNILIEQISWFTYESVRAQIEEWEIALEDPEFADWIDAIKEQIVLLESFLVILQHPAFVPVEHDFMGWERPLTAERIELILAIMDETDCEETLAAIEYDREMLDRLMEELTFWTAETVLSHIDWLESQLDDPDAEWIGSTDWIEEEIEFLLSMLPILEHPAFESMQPVWPERAMTHENLELLLAMLNECDDPETLAAIEAGYEVLQHLLMELSWMMEFIDESLAFMEEMLADADNEEFIQIIEAEIALLEAAITVVEHPAFVPVEHDFGGWRIGLVLHTLNDNLTYLNENFPGLIQTALGAYSLFLERVLTLPAGSLE